MKSRLVAAIVLLIGLATTGLEAQTSGPTPESQNPTGDTGALKPQVQTGGSYDAHSGNATRIVNDLQVPGAVGIYGLDFTRYWNSTHNDYDDSEMEWPRDFGDSGWSHSWRWMAAYEYKYPAEILGTDTDNNQWTTAINITFPDGHTTQYKTVRLGHGEWMVPGTDHFFGPPYSDSEKSNFAYGGTGVHDHICNMATDGSEFWLCRGDGGSVHFVNMVATEVFDPHGLRTALTWDGDGNLHVEPDGGRFLKISFGQVLGAWVITGVEGGTGPNGTGVTQRVYYTYANVPGTYGVALQNVVYDNEDNPEGPGKVTANYHYGNCFGEEPAANPPICSGADASLEPLLKRADDPHYAGAMTIIRYNYRAVACPRIEDLPGDPLQYHNHVSAQPYAIAQEKSDNGITVSSFSIDCESGLRHESTGLGNSRTFYFGSAATAPAGGYGFQLGQLTDFWRYPEPTPPYERQNYDTSGAPRQIWDGRGYLTEAVTTSQDDSGEPGEIHRIDGSVDYYNRTNPAVSGSAAIDPNQGMHNSYNHWVFSETHQINAGASYTIYYTRDSRRRVTDIAYPDGSHELFTYNNLNEVLTHTLPSGAVITRVYDGRGRLTQESNSVDIALSPLDFTSYTYYESGNQTDLVETMTNGRARSVGSVGIFSTRMTYNGRHQITTVDYPDTSQSPCPTSGPSAAPSPTPTATATATPTATATATATATPPLPVAAPDINPNGGTYPSTPPTVVTITTATEGARIRYTLDGSTPSETNGTLITASSGTAPVTSSPQGTVLKAIAFKSGWVTSAVVSSAAYTMPKVADPVISPNGGSYPSTSTTTVTITTDSSGANIRYTLDGTMPSQTNGILIAASSGTVAVTSSAQGTVLKAIAFKSGWTPSTVTSSASYTMPKVADPVISPDSGSYPSTSPTTVTITTDSSGANIRYTLDGTMPSETSGILIAASSGTVAVTSSAQGTVVKAIAFKSGWTPSAVTSSASYTMPKVADPVISPNGGTYPSTPPTSVTVTTATGGANIRYTLDGTMPSETNGTLIAASSGTVAVTSTAQGAVLKAIAFKSGWTPSAVTSSASYTMPKVADPVISPEGGTYPSGPAITVILTTSTSGANMRYTLDGTVPSESNGTLISASSGTVAVTSTAQGTVLKAIAFEPGWTPSAVKSSAWYSMPRTIAAGDRHTVALKPDGTLLAWGDNSYNQLGDGTTTAHGTPQAIPNLTGVIAISAGARHSLALRSDGTVWAWGSNGSGQLGDGTTTSRSIPVRVNLPANIIAISAGNYHGLALRADGTVWAWGSNGSGRLGDGTSTQRNTPVQLSALANVVAVAAGNEHSLAVKADGTVWSWGSNLNGQLGDGTTTSHSVPAQIGGLSNVAVVGAGDSHAVAVTRSGTVYAWGNNASGRLGDGTTTQRTSPVAVSGLSGIIDVEAGVEHSVALRNDGKVFAFGDNTSGQLGDGTVAMHTTPIQVPGIINATAIAAGSHHTAIQLTDGTVLVGGSNDYGQIGNGRFGMRSVPIVVPGLSGVMKIAAGDNFAVALKSDATIVAWGDNSYGQLGDGTTTLRTVPVPVPNLSAVIAISAGAHHTLVLKQDGTVWAWGSNGSGQLGDNSTTQRSTPVRAGTLSGIIAISAGGYHSLALKSDGTIWAWGSNGSGRLGNGNTNQRNSPVQVSGLTDVTTIAGGGAHSLAVKSDGTAWAWGSNANGQLGDGTTTARTTPVQITLLSGISSVAAGDSHSLAISSNGSLYAWGNNGSGRLGDNTTTQRTSPVLVSSALNLTKMSGGTEHSLSLNIGGMAYDWGSNSNGQLGNGSYTQANAPQQLAGFTGLTAIAAGGHFSLALKSNGEVLSWGSNDTGQIGDGATGIEVTPVPVNQ